MLCVSAELYLKTSVSSALEALAMMRYINLRFTLHYITRTTEWLGSLVFRALDLRLNGRKFDSRPPRLVLRWVIVFGRTNHLSISPNHPGPTQPPTLSGTGNEYQPKCDDALGLGSKFKGRYGSAHLWINVWVADKTV